MTEYALAALAGVGLGTLLAFPIIADTWWRFPLYCLIALVLWFATAAVIWQPWRRELGQWDPRKDLPQ